MCFIARETDQVGPEHEGVEQDNWRPEEGEYVVEEEYFQLECEFGTVECVEEDGLLPAVTLLDEVCDVEGRLLLDHCTLPLDGVTLIILGQTHCPVLAHTAL